MNIQPITIPGPGYSLAADWHLGLTTDTIMLFLPGYGSSKRRNVPLAQEMVKRTGQSALVLDLSGHGESPLNLDNTRPAQHVLEVVCVFDWLVEQYPGAKISLIGCSYGGFMAANLAKHRNFHSLILRAPAIYLPSDFYRPQRLFHGNDDTTEFRHNAPALAQHPVLAPGRTFTGRTYVLAHGLDETIPVETSAAYAKAFDAELYTAKNFVHTFTMDAPAEDKEAYWATLARWLAD